MALHGFAGTGRAWDGVGALLDPRRVRLFAPDLPGHGRAWDGRSVTFEATVARVLDAAPERFALCGYSMGGRIALHLALRAPERVTRLVLVATTAGIEDGAERAARRTADEAFADEIERGTIEAFVERWSAQPLFAGDPPEAQALWRADMRRNDPAGLAASLRGTGTGAMESLWARLPRLAMPAAVLAGARDAKFAALAERLAAALPDAGAPEIVPDAGHGLPREAPEAIAAALTP